MAKVVRRGTVVTVLCALIACGLLCGCAAPRGVLEYFGDRGRDFVDCWRISAGPALGIHARARALMLVDEGIGFAAGHDFGYDGPGGAFPGTWRKMTASLGLVLLMYNVDVRGLEKGAEWGPFLKFRLKADESLKDLPPAEVTELESIILVTGYQHREHSRTLPPGTEVADMFWTQAEATPGLVSVRFGLNVVEFFDWFLGIGCIDFLGDDAFVGDTPGCAAIMEAAREGRIDAVRDCLDESSRLAYARNRSLRTPLHEAAQAGHKEIVELLLSYNADAEAKDKEKKTPLELARDANQAAVVEIIENHM